MKQTVTRSAKIVALVLILGLVPGGCVPLPIPDAYTTADLGGLDGFPVFLYSEAMCINNSGQICGIGSTVIGYEHVFLWDETHGMRSLGPADDNWQQLCGMSEDGVVAGNSESDSGDGHAFE